MTAVAVPQPRPADRWLVVANPRAQAGTEALRQVLRRIQAVAPDGHERAPRESVDRIEVLETRGDGCDVARIARALRERNGDQRAAIERVIAAGGDGTTRDVIQAFFADPALAPARSGPRPSLAVLPLGTANNFARALGLESVRRGGAVALHAAVAAALHGNLTDVDLGECNQHYFAGSLAVGCDADILVRRNRLRSSLGLTGALGGYPLYLAACALELTRRHGGAVRLAVDPDPSADGADVVASRAPGSDTSGSGDIVANLLVTTTPIYAGEFRFVAAPTPLADGALDLHVCRDRGEYLREYATAWRRHVRAARGEAVAASRRVRRATRIDIDAAHPITWQLDGEEQAPTQRFRIRVRPAALQIHLPLARA